MRNILVAGLALLLGFGQCKSPEEAVSYRKTEREYKDIKKTLSRFAALMEGDFSNAQQYKENPEASVRVDMHTRRIWPERSDAVWFYVEQLSPQMPSEPLSQRIYKITQPSPNIVECEMMYFEGMKAYVGDWKKPNPLSDVKIAQLESLENCSIPLDRLSSVRFKGGNKNCLEPFGVQIHHTDLEVELSPNSIITVQTGYTKEGRQVFQNRTVFEKL